MAKAERNYGIDLLRFVSMFFVVVLHSMLYSGALEEGSGFYRPAWLIETAAFGAVNIFGMISGYVGFREKKKPFRVKPLLLLWGLGLFYSLAILAVTAVVDRGAISKDMLMTSILPLSHGAYWYLTAYLFVLLMMPVMNAGVRELTEKQCKRGVWIILSIVAILSMLKNDLFHMSGGYAAIWLVVMYLVGALMKKSDFLAKLKKRWCVLGIVVCVAAMWLVKITVGAINKDAYILTGAVSISYVSPAVLLMSILYVRLFSSIRIANAGIVGVVKWVTPCVFGIYLLNSHPLIQKYYAPLWFGAVKDMSGFGALAYILVFSIVFVVAAIVIDKIRQYLVRFILAVVKHGK